MTQYPEENLLANALSPYLLQHRGNPVHWREWNAATFSEAEATGKPILLSIGYAACHWCHVMAHESFEDDETAALMNRHFVNIKVDREERPDVDQVYMTALHAMGEQGGWPLTMFLTPKREPFWGGTYFPPVSRYGRPGFRDVLTAIAKLYAEDAERIARNVDAVRTHLSASLAVRGTAIVPEAGEIDQVWKRLLGALDPVNAGLGHAPKFPNAALWECLWRGSLRGRDTHARQAALDWIRALCRGGIYDHLGGGLHRYTVDARWLVPHFEKMLYDNAQFIHALCLCYRTTKEQLFRSRIEETVDFLLTEMRLPAGGFAASFDADSEGEEGRFYVWTKSEIDSILASDAPEFSRAYDVTAEGNWDGKVILNQLSDEIAPTAKRDQQLAHCRQQLLKERRKRTPPARDDKVLVDWNALTISALSEAATVLKRPDWLAAAREAFTFVAGSVRASGRLAHAWRDGRAAGPALASDLAAMIDAAVTLYAATLDESLLVHARDFAHALAIWHGDGEGGYFLAPSDRSDLLIRALNDQDEAVPSATARVITALSRLALATDDPEMSAEADRALASAWGRVRNDPFSAVGVVNAADTIERAAKLVTTGATATFEEVMSAQADPARIDFHATTAEDIHDVLGAFAQTGVAEAGAAYLCRNMSCLPPVFSAAELAALLKSGQTATH